MATKMDVSNVGCIIMEDKNSGEGEYKIPPYILNLPLFITTNSGAEKWD